MSPREYDAAEFIQEPHETIVAVLKPTRGLDGVHGPRWPEPLSDLVGVACLWKVTGTGDGRIAQPATVEWGGSRFVGIIVHVDHLHEVKPSAQMRAGFARWLADQAREDQEPTDA